MKVDIVLYEFPGQSVTNPYASDFIRNSMREAEADPRFGRVVHSRLIGTPITALRNRACKIAIREKFDYIVMIDSDVKADHQQPDTPSDLPFFKSSFDFIFDRHLGVPCMIAAPYVGPPPHEIPYMFRWRTKQSAHPNLDWQLEMFTREEAALMGGISRVAAAPTGLVIIDVRGLSFLPLPWFFYGYQDEYEAEVVMTEDVAMTRNWAMSPAPKYDCPKGLPLYANWDAWCLHNKNKLCGKPIVATEDGISSAYIDFARRGGYRSDERLLFLDERPYDDPVVYKGDQLITRGFDSFIDPRSIQNTVPKCVGGFVDRADMARKGHALHHRTETLASPKPQPERATPRHALADRGVPPQAELRRDVQVIDNLPPARQPSYEDESFTPYDPLKVTNPSKFVPQSFPCADPLAAPPNVPECHWAEGVDEAADAVAAWADSLNLRLPSDRECTTNRAMGKPFDV